MLFNHSGEHYHLLTTLLNLPMPKGRGFLLIEAITGLLVGCSSPELSSLVASYKRRRQPLPQFHQR